MDGIGQLIETVFWTLIGCFIGTVFAGASLWFKRRILSIGTAALLFNALPIIVVAFVMLWNRFQAL